MSERSLGKGFVGIEETVLYRVPNNTSCRTTMLTFANTGLATVALNVYKKIGNVNYQISPHNLIFPAGYLAQEDGPMTLSANDSIVAICDVAAVVSYTINGVETIIPKT